MKPNIDANRLLRTRPIFSRSLMVSVAVAVTKLGSTELFFVEPGVKVNGEYYRNVLLMKKMLPAIWEMSSDFFIFQQDSATQHIEQRTPLRCCVVKHFIGPELWPWKLTRPQSSWLQNLGSNTGTRLPDSNMELRRVEGAPHCCVGRVEAECHWQSYWTVAAKAESLRPNEGTSLRTSY